MATKQKKQTHTAAVLFGIYGIIMLYLLFIWNRCPMDGVPYWEQVRKSYNLTPLDTVRNLWHILTDKECYPEKWETYSIYHFQVPTAAINLLGNVIMFVPLGTLLPATAPKLRKFFPTFFASAGLIIAVEVLQLFSLQGYCDIDDLILNIIGVMIGYVLWKLWDHRKCRK